MGAIAYYGGGDMDGYFTMENNLPDPYEGMTEEEIKLAEYKHKKHMEEMAFYGFKYNEETGEYYKNPKEKAKQDKD